MGLPRAIKAHASNNLVEAEAHYQRALDQNIQAPVLFQNYGALLSKIGKSDYANDVYKRGLSLHPQNPGILRNYANLLKVSRPTSAISFYLRFLKITCADKNNFSLETYQIVVCDLSDVLLHLGCNTWAFELLRHAINTTGLSPGLLKNLFTVSNRITNSQSVENTLVIPDTLFEELLQQTCTPIQQISLYYGLAYSRVIHEDFSSAYKFYDLALNSFILSRSDLTPEDNIQAQRVINDNSWNFSCLKLTLADFDGWRLFDFGLVAAAPGKQCWQRALTKPFTDQEIPIWRGESVSKKRLLLLDEQAIGDVMMFLTCIPDLIRSVSSVGILLNQRLASIYRRTFSSQINQNNVSIYTKQDIANGVLTHDMFDYQSPIGSVYQYLYSSFSNIAQSQLQILSNTVRTNELRTKYLPKKLVESADPLLVGISWRGGGTQSRIKDKSINVDTFYTIINQIPGVRFVSLQYGESADQCQKWSNLGIDIVYDKSVDPLKDMDNWLSQVDACDAVLSVANTTIHGSGGLGKPTLCLLSQQSDWRWLKDNSLSRSYWYPSVGIVRQDSSGNWNSAISQAREWLYSRCPYPIGRQW